MRTAGRLGMLALTCAASAACLDVLILAAERTGNAPGGSSSGLTEESTSGGPGGSTSSNGGSTSLGGSSSSGGSSGLPSSAASSGGSSSSGGVSSSTSGSSTSSPNTSGASSSSGGVVQCVVDAGFAGDAAGYAVDTAAGNNDAGTNVGTGDLAQFEGPTAVAGDEVYVYVFDQPNNRIVRVEASVPYNVSVLAGPDAGFTSVAMTANASSELYIADTGRHLILHGPATAPLSTVVYAGSLQGFQNGPGLQARFNTPSAIAVADDGAVYVADTGNHVIRRIDPADGHNVTTIAGTPGQFGSNDSAVGTGAKFNRPGGLAIWGNTLFVADTSNRRIRAIDISGAQYSVTTVAGVQLGTPQDGYGADARFSNPTHMTAWEGYLYLVDGVRIRRVNTQCPYDVVTLLGLNGQGYLDATTAAAQARNPMGVAAMPISGNPGVYFSDEDNIRLRRLYVP
ncbi:MAG: hypothetical protein AB2A00_42520 [Myxococcota bacterium]